MATEFTKMDASSLHHANKIILLKLIQQKKEISRSELTKVTGLTPPTVARLVNELVENDKLAEYVGVGNSSGGRPPVIVRFKSENNYIIGIDLGATYIRGCLVDLEANLITEIQIPTEINKGFSVILDKAIQLIKRLENRKENDSKIWGIGMGVAGLVNRETGIIERSPDFGWSNIDLRKELQIKLDYPFFYDNSTRLMALGELKLGANQEIKNFAVINMGFGIASGLVIEGKLVKGNAGFAGEFGHIQVDTNSKVKCKCGMYGCLEALASGHRISELGKIEMEKNKDSILWEQCHGNINLVSAELIGKSAQMGDKASIKIYEEITDYLSIGIGTISNLLNPGVIYIGGGISLNGAFLYKMIQKKVTKYLIKPNANLKILPSTFGEQATSIGAVSLVLEKITNLELVNN